MSGCIFATSQVCHHVTLFVPLSLLMIFPIHHFSVTSSPNEALFSFPAYRLSLYKALFSSLLSSSRSSLSSSSLLPIAIRVFRFGRSSDRDFEITQFCQECLMACQTWIHPSPLAVPPSASEVVTGVSLNAATVSCYSQRPLIQPPPISPFFSANDIIDTAPLVKSTSVPLPSASFPLSETLPQRDAPSKSQALAPDSSPSPSPSAPHVLRSSFEITQHISALTVQSHPPKQEEVILIILPIVLKF